MAHAAAVSACARAIAWNQALALLRLGCLSFCYILNGPKPCNTGGNVVSLLFHEKIYFPQQPLLTVFSAGPQNLYHPRPDRKMILNMTHTLDSFRRNLRPSWSMYDLQFISSSISRFEKPVKKVHYL